MFDKEWKIFIFDIISIIFHKDNLGKFVLKIENRPREQIYFMAKNSSLNFDKRCKNWIADETYNDQTCMFLYHG